MTIDPGLYDTLSDAEIADQLGLTVSQVGRQRRKAGIYRAPPKGGSLPKGDSIRKPRQVMATDDEYETLPDGKGPTARFRAGLGWTP